MCKQPDIFIEMWALLSTCIKYSLISNVYFHHSILGSDIFSNILFIKMFMYLNWYPCFRVSIKESSVAKLGSVCRRVYRIFSHAYFHHRSIFDEFEIETCLCKRFTQFVTKYNLMSKDNLIVPILEEDNISGESEA